MTAAGTAAASLRSAFFESFTSYAVATDKLSFEVVPAASGKPRPLFPTVNSLEEGEADGEATPPAAADADVDGISSDRKLLVLLSNCAFVRGSTMPTFYNR